MEIVDLKTGIKSKCEHCGHTQIVAYDKATCDWCGYYIYKNEKQKFLHKLDVARKRAKKNEKN